MHQRLLLLALLVALPAVGAESFYAQCVKGGGDKKTCQAQDEQRAKQRRVEAEQNRVAQDQVSKQKRAEWDKKNFGNNKSVKPLKSK